MKSVKKNVSILLSAAMLAGTVPLIAQAKSSEEYLKEGYTPAVIMKEEVDIHNSMYIEGDVYCAGEIRVDDSGGNKIDGHFISGTEGTEYRDKKDEVLGKADGYIHYTEHGKDTTIYSTKPEFFGSVMDRNTVFDYELPRPLFSVPEISNVVQSQKTYAWDEKGKLVVTRDTYFKKLEISGDSFSVDVSSGDVAIVIDSLKFGGDAKINIIGTEGNTNRLRLYLQDDSVEKLFLNHNDLAQSWFGDGDALEAAMEQFGDSQRVDLCISGDEIELGGNSRICANLYLDAEEVKLGNNGIFSGNVVTNAEELTVTGQTYVYGQIYAPEAEVEVEASGMVVGQVIGEELEISGQGKIYYSPVQGFGSKPWEPEATPEPTAEPQVTPEPTVEPTQQPEATPVATEAPVEVPEYQQPYQLDNRYAYIFGRSDTQMQADDMMLRGEASAALYRLLKQNNLLGGFSYDINNAPVFADVLGRWDRSALEYMAYIGVYHGDSSQNIVGSAPISRGEAFRLICLSLGFTKDTSLTDEQYCAILVDAGYVNGYEDGDFRLDHPITRAEFCKIYNMITKRDAYTLQQADGTAVTPETYGFSDMEQNWAYEVMLKATSAYDEDGHVDVQARANRNVLDDYS